MDRRENEQELERIRGFYESTYYRDVAAATPLPRHLRRLARRLGVKPGMQVLDVACGQGLWLRAAAARGAQPAGVDLSSRAIEVCRADLPQGEFHAVPAESLPFASGRFDLVTCLGSLEHFVDPAGALREMVRVARDDARFVLLVPNADFLTRRLGLYGGTEQAGVKEVVRTPEAWLALFEASGIEVTQRWRDLHVVSRHWILARGWLRAPLRALQALALCVWPLRWQYQIYHLGRGKGR
jgi:2-polyprenyl-3-methyl-5-hydroxy-6-metoxy-1,4-benzoquinol methylase